MRTPSIKLIFLAGLIAGTLDILGALTVYSLILHKGSVMLILQRIASAALGQVAFKGGWAMALCGLGFHYIIVYCFTTAYVSLYPYLPFLKKHRLASGLLYGLFAWARHESGCAAKDEIRHPPFSMELSLYRHGAGDAFYRIAGCLYH